MTVHQLALMPPSISGVSLSPTASKKADQNPKVQQDQDAAASVAFSPAAMEAYAKFLPIPVPDGSGSSE